MDLKKESNRMGANGKGRKWKVQETGWQSTYQSDVLNFLLFLFFFLRQRLLGMLHVNMICFG